MEKVEVLELYFEITTQNAGSGASLNRRHAEAIG